MAAAAGDVAKLAGVIAEPAEDVAAFAGVVAERAKVVAAPARVVVEAARGVAAPSGGVAAPMKAVAAAAMGVAAAALAIVARAEAFAGGNAAIAAPALSIAGPSFAIARGAFSIARATAPFAGPAPAISASTTAMAGGSWAIVATSAVVAGKPGRLREFAGRGRRFAATWNRVACLPTGLRWSLGMCRLALTFWSGEPVERSTKPERAGQGRILPRRTQRNTANCHPERGRAERSETAPRAEAGGATISDICLSSPISPTERAHLSGAAEAEGYWRSFDSAQDDRLFFL